MMFDIIIATYNAKNKLKRCLVSLEKHTKDYLLTVINNNSTDGTALFLKQRNVNVINTNKNLGFCGGANLALRNTHNKFIVLLDDDVEVTEGWLPGLYKHMNKGVGMVGCKVVFPNNRIHSADYRVTPLSLMGRGEIDKGQRDYVKECDSFIGPCWLMRRELLKTVGYFDEKFFPSQYEDIDYCLRARVAGYKLIYNGKVKVIHHHLNREGSSIERIRNEQWFFKKWKNLYNRFPSGSSHPADKYVARGIKCLEKDKYEQALVEFRKAESVDKRFSEPLYVGRALIGIEKHNEAIKQFKKILKLNPSNAFAHFYMGIALTEIGDPEAAIREFQKVVSLNTLISSVHYHLALIYKKLGLDTRGVSAKALNFLSSRVQVKTVWNQY